MKKEYCVIIKCEEIGLNKKIIISDEIFELIKKDTKNFERVLNEKACVEFDKILLTNEKI